MALWNKQFGAGISACNNGRQEKCSENLFENKKFYKQNYLFPFGGTGREITHFSFNR